MGKTIQNFNTTKSSNWGLSSVLTVIFVCCKLFGVIDWSWWWVLSPLWIGLAIMLVLVLIGVLVAFLFD